MSYADASNDIIAAVAERHRFTFSELVGPSKAYPIQRARREAATRIRDERKLTWPEIASLFGRPASTVQGWYEGALR